MEELLKPSIDIQNMMTWAHQIGIRWPKLHYPVKFHPGYLGSVATEDILPGEKIIWAPNSALFTSKLAYESELKEVFDSAPEIFNRPMLAMMTFIIWEKFKGPSSKWEIFLKAQPKENLTLQDWDDVDLQELQDERLMIDSKLRKDYHVFAYSFWKTSMERFSIFNEEMLALKEYTWAFRLIATRSFGKFMPYITMIPVAEFLNHENVQTFYSYQHPDLAPDATGRYSGKKDSNDHDDELLTSNPIIKPNWSNLANLLKRFSISEEFYTKINKILSEAAEKDQKDLIISAEHLSFRPANMDLTESDEKIACICTGPEETYRKGDQVYMTYGRYSNRQLLVSYGFALKENKYNYASLFVNVKEFMESIDRPVDTVQNDLEVHFKLKKATLCEKLLCFLRILLWEPDLDVDSCFEPQKIQFEVKVLAHAKTLINKTLANFPTSLDYDRKSLENCETVRRYFVILYRLQVKEILEEQLNYLQTFLKFLTGHDDKIIENSEYFTKIQQLRNS